MNNKYKILLVEDEVVICAFIKTILEMNSYQVIEGRSCKEGSMLFHSHAPNVIILDLGLPDMDGNELIKEIRKESDVPIIVLSARTNENDKVLALDLGANDYITKPFGNEELMARVRAAIRSYHLVEANRNVGVNRVGTVVDGEYVEKFVTADLVVDYEYRKVIVGGEEVKLTQTEYNIVELLALKSGRVITYKEIVKKIWRYSDEGSIKKLQVNMANIRKKLGEVPGKTKYIANELGVGYRMTTDKI